MTPTPFSIKQGQNLKALRKLRGLSVNAWAELLGIAADSVRRYERGERSVTTEQLVNWAVKLNCSQQSILADLDPRTAQAEAPRGEFRTLRRDESEIFRYLSTEWPGDVHALILAMRLYAALPAEGRAAVMMELILQRDKHLTQEEYPAGMAYIEQAIGGLYTK